MNLEALLRSVKNGSRITSRTYGISYTPKVWSFQGHVLLDMQLVNRQPPAYLIADSPLDALNANLSTLSVSAQERAAKDAAKKEAKAAANEARDSERKAASKVIIKRVERNKRKYVTVVIGLEVFGLENKKIAKDLGKKFATGSSVTRSPAGIEEITVQGDVSDDLSDWLLEVHGNKIPEANIEFVEDKKKKKSEAALP